MGPTVPGYVDYDVYPYDVEKAKELLGGETVKIRYAHQDTSKNGEIAAAMADEFAKAGIEIEAGPDRPDGLVRPDRRPGQRLRHLLERLG